MVVDLRPFDDELTGKVAQTALDEAGITLNKNTIPDDPRSPFVTSGVRIGTPSVTTQGMHEPEMAQIAGAHRPDAARARRRRRARRDPGRGRRALRRLHALPLTWPTPAGDGRVPATEGAGPAPTPPSGTPASARTRAPGSLASDRRQAATVNSWTMPPMKCGTPVPSVISPSADIDVPVGTKQVDDVVAGNEVDDGQTLRALAWGERPADLHDERLGLLLRQREDLVPGLRDAIGLAHDRHLVGLLALVRQEDGRGAGVELVRHALELVLRGRDLGRLVEVAVLEHPRVDLALCLRLNSGLSKAAKSPVSTTCGQLRSSRHRVGDLLRRVLVELVEQRRERGRIRLAVELRR